MRQRQGFDDEVGEVGFVALEMVRQVVAFKVDEDFGVGRAGKGLLAARQEDAVDRLARSPGSPARA